MNIFIIKKKYCVLDFFFLMYDVPLFSPFGSVSIMVVDFYGRTREPDMCRADLKPILDQLLLIRPSARVIYSGLFKDTQQHSACFYREQLGPAPPKDMYKSS